MTRLHNHVAAAVAAITITIFSMQLITTVPTPPVAVIEAPTLA